MTHEVPNHLLGKSLIIGAWRVTTRGAPYPDHVMIFFSDHTFLIHNPSGVQEDPNDMAHGGTHDSVGVGAWVTGPNRDALILATFTETNAYVNDRQPAPDLSVTFVVTGFPSEDDFVARALDTAGHEVSLYGHRIRVDMVAAQQITATL